MKFTRPVATPRRGSSTEFCADNIVDIITKPMPKPMKIIATLTSRRVEPTPRRVSRNTPPASNEKPLTHITRKPTFNTMRAPPAEPTIIASIIGVST